MATGRVNRQYKIINTVVQGQTDANGLLQSTYSRDDWICLFASGGDRLVTPYIVSYALGGVIGFQCLYIDRTVCKNEQMNIIAYFMHT